MPKSRMRIFANCVSLAAISIAAQASAEQTKQTGEAVTAWEASRTVNDSDSVSTGVARRRDRLDSATSTSSIKENEIAKLAPRSLADLFRNLPGIRVEAGAGEGNNSYTVRGLPLVSTGAKYVQLQEDGLPVLEFGDFGSLSSDVFLRADLNVGQVETIRGGSASTFASNGPGGVINLVSKTGEVEGGSFELSSGLNYSTNRADFDYGGRLSDTWRFHVGGFYREGDGPRETGFNAVKGGQLKFNLTKQFAGGYIRFLGKILDDQTPYYYSVPVAISGTNSNPKYRNLPNFSVTNDTLLSPYNASQPAVDTYGNPVINNVENGIRAKAKSFGVEAQFSVADWSITERFRFSDMSGHSDLVYPIAVGPAAGFAQLFSGGAGADLSYATGPSAGLAINPATVNGNGLLALSANVHIDIKSVRNVTNDLRASRVWEVGGGELTTTAGIYKAQQDLNIDPYIVTTVQDVRGNGKTARVDLTLLNGTPITQSGVLAYGVPGQIGQSKRLDLRYDITAPYGSFNFHKGKISIGASVRYDFNKVDGTAGQDLATRAVDVNGDGVISGPEAAASVIVPGSISPVDYHHSYLSYSTGINYRIAEYFSAFARYSRGARAAGDAILLSPAVSRTTGALLDKSAGHDPVRQAEGGVKFRKNGISLNLTGFYVWTRETNTQIFIDESGASVLGLVSRSYRTYGAEFEGSLRRGPFSLNGSATVTGGEITAAENPAFVGNTPRHQAALIYTLTPQYDVDRFTLGVNVIGQTWSYAQDANALKMPAYTTVGLFLQYRPIDRLVLGLNASNIFDVKAFTDVVDPALPASGVGTGRTLYGRLVSTSARFFF